MKVENYIEKIYRDLNPYKNIEYENLYSAFSNNKLIEIFSTIHYLLMDNFKKMNSRLPTKEGTAHFWADDSRKLILAIESAKGLQRALNTSRYKFSVESYYEEVIGKSIGFLSESGGSEIPPHMDRIEIYYTIPIFIPQDILRIKSLSETLNVETHLIGEGSYAHVYKYKDPFYNKNYVIKRAKNNLDDKELERFQREYESMKKFSSPYIIEVYNYDKNKKEYYMEYMDSTLNEYIMQNNAKFTTEKRKGIGRQILKAFQYIHSKGIYHRDISPKNILVKKYDDVDVIKIADFGLIRLPDSQLTSMWTEFKGYYNDPSLVTEGFHTYNIVHETYALTKIIAFIMTGKTNLSNIKDSKINLFVQKGLATDKEKRYQSVKELMHALNKI